MKLKSLPHKTRPNEAEVLLNQTANMPVFYNYDENETHMNKGNITRSKISAYIIRSAAYAVLLSCAVVGFTSSINLPGKWSGLLVLVSVQLSVLSAMTRLSLPSARPDKLSIGWREAILFQTVPKLFHSPRGQKVNYSEIVVPRTSS